MAQTTIPLAVLLQQLAHAGLTITDRFPGDSGPSLGWWARLLDDSLNWSGPYDDPLQALHYALQVLIVTYKASASEDDDALIWETSSFQLGDNVSIAG